MTAVITFVITLVVVVFVGLFLVLLGSKTSAPAHRFGSHVLPHQGVSTTEFVAGVMISLLVIFPLVSVIGGKISQASASSYKEYWSGVEEEARMVVTECRKDGSCRHEYSCDPYTVMVRKTRTNSDGDTETYVEAETHWHDCPYVTHEYSYLVDDSMDETYSFGSHLFPANAEQHRWTGHGHSSRKRLPDVYQGVPPLWTEAKERIEAGNPGGTSQQKSYPNYILANHQDIYEKYSSAIEDYKAEGLMPAVQAEVRKPYFVDRVYFVGVTPPNAKEWQEAVQRLSGHLGRDREGDLHVVVADASKITNPDDYALAVEAYWQSPLLKKHTLSKNGIGLVLGVTNGEVQWSRGFTGMPMGNEALIVKLGSLAGSNATPEALFGKDEGAVWTAVMEEGAGFTRVEMADFEYLKASIPVSDGARWWMAVITIVLSGILWAIFFQVDLRHHSLEAFVSRKGSTAL